MVQRIYQVDVYLRVRRAVMVEGMSIREAARVFGLHCLTAQQSADHFELILNRHRASSFVITSNRSVDEWLGLIEDPVLRSSALDRLANASYQIVTQGISYRERQSPHRALLSAGQGGD